MRPEERLTRTRWTVRIGGRVVRLGPLHFRIGGGRYTVGPLSVRRVFGLIRALVESRVSLPDLAEDADMAAVVGTLSQEFVRALLPLLVYEPIEPRHWRRATPAQIVTVVAKALEVNDVEYILSALKPSDEEGAGSVLDLAHAIVTASAGAYTHHQALDLPMQEALAILDVAGARAEGLPPGASSLTPEQRAEHEMLNQTLTAAGFWRQS